MRDEEEDSRELFWKTSTLANAVMHYEYFMECLRPIFWSFQREKSSDITECVS
jgi:hypothetical protein